METQVQYKKADGTWITWMTFDAGEYVKIGQQVRMLHQAGRTVRTRTHYRGR